MAAVQQCIADGQCGDDPQRCWLSPPRVHPVVLCGWPPWSFALACDEGTSHLVLLCALSLCGAGHLGLSRLLDMGIAHCFTCVACGPLVPSLLVPLGPGPVAVPVRVRILVLLGLALSVRLCISCPYILQIFFTPSWQITCPGAEGRLHMPASPKSYSLFA